MTTRFALMVLAYNCKETLHEMINNCAPFVEKIFVLHSEKPWNYLPSSRQKFKNIIDLDFIRTSIYNSKIEIVSGEWDTEEDERNTCVEIAKKQGFDYLIIQDADEFYTESDFLKNLQEIINNPEVELFRTPWISYWKSNKYIIVNEKNNFIVGYPEFAINLKKDVIFIRARKTNYSQISSFDLPGICHHLSYVMSNKELWEKINTWGHANEFNRLKWFVFKWILYTKYTKNLHPIYPIAWRKAIEIKITNLEKPKNNLFV